MAPSPSSTTTSVQVGEFFRAGHLRGRVLRSLPALRIRPPTSQDLVSIPARFQKTVIHAVSPTTVAVESTGVSQSGVHPPSATQHGLFTSTAEPLLARFLEGFNCTILAYGQTSSGKTFTMTGIDLDADPSDPNNGMGIIPRAVSTIFSKARQLKEERGDTWNFSIKGSFIEIYNEDLIDLLSMDEAGGRREVQIREDKDGHIIWVVLERLIRKGTSIRRTNETDMNAQSSRSHAIFSLTFIQKKFVGTGQPPRSSSPLPPGRSPSRLARPGSMYSNTSTAGNRASSPTPGRPGTPSFASAMGREVYDLPALSAT
ncbi:kinesin-domain-containing protein [Salix suchowensis]|nr:kinesin-domain-containing protein [Salix suchowensis]